MRTERKPGNERPEKEGACGKPRKAERSRVGTAEKHRRRKPGWQGKHPGYRASAGGQRCLCLFL